ncbi:MAG TPA: hypothetical protein VK481_03815 [Gemmatimonadaceae bacterium]|nr:hypothetical protein [Gemmatimonadaceae bacterium]
MTFRNHAFFILALVTVMGACSDTPTQPQTDLEIAFSREDGTLRQNIYVMGVDGTRPTPLTTNDWAGVSGWSPDGARILYQVGPGPTLFGLVTIKADGTGLTTVAGNAFSGKWSPDGSKIAFTSNRDLILNGGAAPTHINQIYVTGSDGTGEVRLTTDSAFNDMGSWSPDGAKIVFTRWTRDLVTNQIFVMNASGGSQLRLTNSSSWDLSPEWSSDGSRIAFVRSPMPNGGKHTIVTMNPDGSVQTELTDPAVDATSPVWSPDGKRIAFIRQGAAAWQIAVMNADGSGQAVLTNGVADALDPSWSPGGDRIAFMDFRDGNWQIYVMNADGTNQTRLAASAQNDRGPSWRPR